MTIVHIKNMFVITFLFLIALCAGVVAFQCSSGHRVHTITEGDDFCVPCEKYTFVTEDNHTYRECKPCTFIEDPDVEVFVSLCNSTHDSVILCTSGLYRLKAWNDQQTDRCEKCTECEFPTRACGGYYDTVCCNPNQEAVLTSGDVYVCREGPIKCGPGQFFSTSIEECLPCPAGTFMSAHNHTYKECLKCEQLSESNATHAIITRPCSRTAPTLFGCEDGYFNDSNNHSYRTCKPCTFIEDPDVEVLVSRCNRTHDSVILCTSGFYRHKARNDQQTDGCKKCTECEFPTRACGGYYDTVCCHPNQEAVLTSGDVYVCRDIPIKCGPGQFSSPTEECLPCPAETFMSAHNHTYTECLKCEQLSENNATHAIITRPCSRTAPTLFGCKDGYFRDPTKESLQTEVPCTLCQSCRLSLRECDMFQDTVCDSKGGPITTSSSLSGNKREETSLDIGIEQGNETSGAVENTSQYTQNQSELPSYIAFLETDDSISYLMIVNLLLLSILILSLISFPIKQSNPKAGHMYVNPSIHLFCFTCHVHKIRFYTIINIATLVAFQILAAVVKQCVVGLLIPIMSFSILIIIVNVIIHCMYMFASSKRRKYLPDVLRTQQLETNSFV